MKLIDVPKGSLAVVLTRAQWRILLEHLNGPYTHEHHKTQEAFDIAVEEIEAVLEARTIRVTPETI